MRGADSRSMMWAAAYYGQRLVVFPWLRRMIARGLAFCIRWQHPHEWSRERDTAEPDDPLRSLQKAGYALLGTLLTPGQLADIRDFLKDKHLADYHDRKAAKFCLADRPEGICLADYDVGDVVNCPHIMALANRPTLIRLAARYLGCKPTISAIRLRWSFLTGDPDADLQIFHRDPDDWRFFKLFVYLTDVDEVAGPHVYISGSHSEKASVFLQPMNDAEALRRYGSERLITISGPSGFGFVADTFGFHKGAMPVKRHRLLLQIQYSILPIGIYRYVPRPSREALELDRYINRLIVV